MTTPDRVALLLARLEPPRRDEVGAIDGLAEILVTHEADVAAAWPALTFERERYLAHLAKWITQRASEPAERVIRTMPAAEIGHQRGLERRERLRVTGGDARRGGAARARGARRG